jgi:hypothetical protein
MSTREERMRAFKAEALQRRRDAEPLRTAAMTVAESFPDDWQHATFRIEIERTETGPSVEITFYEVIGDGFDMAGGSCGGVCGSMPEE